MSPERNISRCGTWVLCVSVIETTNHTAVWFSLAMRASESSQRMAAQSRYSCVAGDWAHRPPEVLGIDNVSKFLYGLWANASAILPALTSTAAELGAVGLWKQPGATFLVSWWQLAICNLQSAVCSFKYLQQKQGTNFTKYQVSNIYTTKCGLRVLSRTSGSLRSKIKISWVLGVAGVDNKKFVWHMACDKKYVWQVYIYCVYTNINK